MKFKHTKLLSINENEDSSYTYIYLVHIKVSMFLSKDYVCMITSTKQQLDNEQLTDNMIAINQLDLCKALLDMEDGAVGFSFNTLLGELGIQKFDQTCHTFYGKPKQWKRMPSP